MCLVVNSPIETPALAAAVRADWSGLTPAEHEHSIEEDALRPSEYGPYLEALKRLLFYYPEAGVATAVRLLNSPISDNPLIDDFMDKRLFKTKDARQQDRLLAEFRKENGEANYGALQLWLIFLADAPNQDKIPAGKVLARAFPGVDFLHPPMYAGIDFQAMRNLVDALSAVPSEAIDEAVRSLLKRTSETHPAGANTIEERCELAHACAWRLTKPDERDAFEKSYAAIISSLPRNPQPAKMTAFSKRFQAFLDDLIGKLTS
jgi:hypothetical protein